VKEELSVLIPRKAHASLRPLAGQDIATTRKASRSALAQNICSNFSVPLARLQFVCR